MPDQSCVHLRIQWSQLMDFLERKGVYKSEREQQPDLLVMDIKLDLVDGFKILNHIKENHRLSKMPVYVLTKTIIEEDQVRAKRLGVKDYFQKPLRENEWLDMVGAICSTTFDKKDLNCKID